MNASGDQSRPGNDDIWTVREVLQWTTQYLKQRGFESPRLDAEILLAHARDCQRIELYTRFDQPLSSEQRFAMKQLVERRAQSEPVAYLVGHREFFGFDFEVNSDVLIPRPETELLVESALELIREHPEARVLDIGTGSGCIAVSLAAMCDRASVTAVDVSETALAVARRNAERHNVVDRIDFIPGDGFQTLSQSLPFDIIVSNPPYIATSECDELPADVKFHEPPTALFSGERGLDLLTRIIDEAPNYLTADGHLLLEFSPEQTDALKQIIVNDGRYTDIAVRPDIAGLSRVIQSRRQPDHIPHQSGSTR